MRVKEHQRGTLTADFRLGGILFILLAFAWAFYLIHVPGGAAQTLTAFFVFLVLMAPVILLGNPTLVKVLTTDYATHPRRLWLVPLVLWCVASLYILAAAPANLLIIPAGALYCFLPLIATILLNKKQHPVGGTDALVILLVLLPMQFPFLTRYGAPPAQPVFFIYPMIGIIHLLVIYLTLRPLPNFSYTLRLKDNDWRSAIMNFLFLFILVFIPGIALRFFTLSHNMMPFGEMVQQFLFIGFFIALPEELLFRGIIQNFIAGQITTKKNTALLTLAPASLISGLAHYHNAFVLDFGGNSVYPGGGKPVWVNILIAFAASWLFGWTLLKTRKVTAATFVHTLFIWVWLVILNS
ncbi:MAG TPA: CPBP family intramembrane metalloprotease [bacterium]|nr:CPBP family intramembrane metalloprotease [bacterium]HPN46055.1 CPBP family intramembrane metalloprotease [bacterium]